jgi:hypothetical protein
MFDRKKVIMCIFMLDKYGLEMIKYERLCVFYV